MSKIFGVDGVKGIANTELSSSLAFKLGRAGAIVISEGVSYTPTILVGRDTRISGHMLESALMAGICSAGVNVESVGIIPSPAIAYLAKKYKLDAAVSISASHKPMEYNGIKFYDSKGYKIDTDMEEKIEAYVNGDIALPESKTGAALGKISRTHTALRDYVDLVKSTMGTDLSGLKVAIDCANGAAYQCAKLCFKELGADVEVINNSPTGTNINDNCGSAHMSGLIALVTNHGCNFGLAMDGDGDHLLACDENGNIISADKIAAICSDHIDIKSAASDGLVSAVCLAGMYAKKGKEIFN